MSMGWKTSIFVFLTTDGWLNTNAIPDGLTPSSDDTGLGPVTGGEGVR